MGMTCTLRRASDADVRQLVADPTQVGSFLYGPAPIVRRVQSRGVLGLILRLLPIRIEEVDPSAPLPDPPGDDVLDLEKSWHGLHFLFTGSAQDAPLPNGFLISGGFDLESEDDDSTPRLLDATQVREIDMFLQSLTRDELTRRYDARRMTELEIYPDVIWMRDTNADHSARDHLLDAFDELQSFVAVTHERGQAIVVQVS
jgi:uncharacterized protein DUF1877